MERIVERKNSVSGPKRVRGSVCISNSRGLYLRSLFSSLSIVEIVAEPEIPRYLVINNPRDALSPLSSATSVRSTAPFLTTIF